MSRKDYVIIAAALLKSKSNTDAWQRTVCNVADALKEENPRFDSPRFFAACGTQDYRNRFTPEQIQNRIDHAKNWSYNDPSTHAMPA